MILKQLHNKRPADKKVGRLIKFRNRYVNIEGTNLQDSDVMD